MDRRDALSTLGSLGSLGGLAPLAGLAAATPAAQAAPSPASMQAWPLATAQRTGIHDVAPAPDGGVWIAAQRSGHLGWFEPKSGKTELIALGSGSSPHGVIQGPDQAAWLTDGGQQAIVRVAWPSREVRLYRLSEGTPYANLNTCAFDAEGNLWFTGQSGVTGRVLVKTGQVSVWDAPKGRGPYGICATPAGDIWYCSLAGSFIAQLDLKTGASRVVEPPTPRQGARRVWSDAQGRIWVSEWNSGNLSLHDPARKTWRSWKLPGDNPRNYAVYVDERDMVWMSDWGSNSVLRFDPVSEKFETWRHPRESANVRQILGRPGEVWLPESGTEHLAVMRYS